MRLALLVAHVAAGALVAVAAHADPPAPSQLRLRDVVAAAARGNPTLGMALQDFAAARGQVLAAAGLNDPVLDARGTWVETHQPADGTQPGTFDQLVGTAGVTQPLPTGGNIGLHLTNEWDHTVGGPLPATTQNPAAMGVMAGAGQFLWAPSLQLSIFHPLLRGFGVGVARAQQRKARIGILAATGTRGATAANLMRDVVTAYWELYFAERQLDIRRQSARSARDMLEIVKANIAVGKQPPSASAEVEVAIANRESDVIDAEQELLADAVEVERLSGHERIDTVAHVAEEPPADAPVPSLEAVLQGALDGNFDLLAARAGVDSARVDVDVARNGKLPQLDVSASGGPQGAKSSAGAAYGELGRFGAYTVSAGLAFTQPTINRAARGLDEVARAAYRKADLNETAVRQLVQANATRAVAGAANAARRMALMAPITDVARLDLEAERARFTAGRSSNFDVLRRQDEVAGVELRRLRARVDYLQFMATVEALTGEILPRLGVTLK